MAPHLTELTADTDSDTADASNTKTDKYADYPLADTHGQGHGHATATPPARQHTQVDQDRNSSAAAASQEYVLHAAHHVGRRPPSNALGLRVPPFTSLVAESAVRSRAVDTPSKALSAGGRVSGWPSRKFRYRYLLARFIRALARELLKSCWLNADKTPVPKITLACPDADSTDSF